MRTIAITGGKGGVGKTSLSTAMAMAFAQQGVRTVLFDADLGLANVDVVLGIQPEFTLQHVMNDEKTIREILHEGPFGMNVITGAAGVASLINAGPKRMRKFLNQLYAIESDHDVLIFDTGSGIDRRVTTFLRIADDVVVVVTPDAASITDGYATIKQLVRSSKTARIHILVNMADTEMEAQRTFTALETITKKFLKVDIQWLGFVHSDREAAKCIRSRKPFLTAAPECAASQDIRRIVESTAKWEPVGGQMIAEKVRLVLEPRTAA